jgi:hypothetical protein
VVGFVPYQFVARNFLGAGYALVGAILRACNIAGAGSAPALTGLLSGPLGGVGPALSAVGLSCLLAAAVVLFALPETRWMDLDLVRTTTAGAT